MPVNLSLLTIHFVIKSITTDIFFRRNNILYYIYILIVTLFNSFILVY